MINLKQIGRWKISILETGSLMLDGGAMMGSVPKVLWEKTNPPDSLNRIELAMRCLLLDDGKNLVLIETGIGDKCSSKFKEIFSIKQSKNALSDTLSEYGYSNKNITHVVLVTKLMIVIYVMEKISVLAVILIQMLVIIILRQQTL